MLYLSAVLTLPLQDTTAVDAGISRWWSRDTQLVSNYAMLACIRLISEIGSGKLKHLSQCDTRLHDKWITRPSVFNTHADMHLQIQFLFILLWFNTFYFANLNKITKRTVQPEKRFLFGSFIEFSFEEDKISILNSLLKSFWWMIQNAKFLY